MALLPLQRGKRVTCFSLAKLWHSCCRWASAHQSYFPLFQHIAINYPPAAGWSPFLSRTGNVLHTSLYPNKVESTIHQKDRLEVGGKRLEGDAEDYYKRGYLSHPSAFPYSNNVESTIPRRTSVPLSLQKGTVMSKVHKTVRIHTSMSWHSWAVSLRLMGCVLTSKGQGCAEIFCFCKGLILRIAFL